MNIVLEGLASVIRQEKEIGASLSCTAYLFNSLGPLSVNPLASERLSPCFPPHVLGAFWVHHPSQGDYLWGGVRTFSFLYMDLDLRHRHSPILTLGRGPWKRTWAVLKLYMISCGYKVTSPEVMNQQLGRLPPAFR